MVVFFFFLLFGIITGCGHKKQVFRHHQERSNKPLLPLRADNLFFYREKKWVPTIRTKERVVFREDRILVEIYRGAIAFCTFLGRLPTQTQEGLLLHAIFGSRPVLLRHPRDGEGSRDWSQDPRLSRDRLQEDRGRLGRDTTGRVLIKIACCVDLSLERLHPSEIGGSNMKKKRKTTH